jgi:OmpA-OmpF porin, OOP family
MDTDGKGEAQPLNPNTTAENKAQNRRVEFIKF